MREALVDVDDRQVLRVNEVGEGEPILFVHGSGGSGAYWAPLVAELASEFRCILIDRPGWTLSTPIDYSTSDFGSIAAGLQAGLLDSLQLQASHVVGGSIGDLYALRLAQQHPDRVGSLVLLGGGPLSSRITPPTFVRLLRSPLGRLIVRVPQRPAMVRKQMEGLGHKTSLDRGSIPDELIQLYVSTSRYTAAMRHERDLVRSIAERGRFVDGLTLTSSELADIPTPTTMIYGSDDPVGNHELWEGFLQEMPNGTLHVVPDAGHLPWYDQPRHVADLIRRHLDGAGR